jgi:membrane-associated protein
MVEAVEGFLRQYGYPVLFAGVMLENAGIPLPGETAVLFAGYLSSTAGGAVFSLPWVIVLTVVAAVIGDNLGFWLGHRFARPYLLRGRRFLMLTPHSMQITEGYFAKYGSWTIFFARFITGVRVFGALAAGTAGMHWLRFLVANAAGALTWAVTMSLLGFFFGNSLELIERGSLWIGVGVLAAVTAIVATLHWIHRRKGAQREKGGSEEPRP